MSKSKRKKRAWIITGVIVAIIVALAIAAIVLLVTGGGEGDNGDTPAQESLNLEDYLSGKFVPNTFNATWTSGTELLYRDSDDNLVLLNMENSTSKILLDSTDNVLLTAFDYHLSGDGLYLLVAYNYQKLYRHSFKAQYQIIDINTGSKYDLMASNQSVQLVAWAPVGNALIYVYENNIYYKSSATSEDSVTITSTSNFVTNGIPDWVYEEEVFSSNKALWFSPDGTKLAFGRFNDTQVPVMVIPVYGEPGSMLFQYPRANLIKYPKAGTTNPTVTLHVVTLSNPGTELDLQVPTALENDPILSTVEWATNDIVSTIWMNRVQNQASITTYDTSASSVTPTVIKSLESTEGWLELFTPPKFSSDGSKLILILSQDQGGDSGSYRHIVLFNREENAEEQPLTAGTFVVTEILSWNQEDNLIYYLANTANDYAVQHLYSVSVDTKAVQCLTCQENLSTDCSYNSAEFSTDGSYYALTCEGPNVPRVSIYSKEGQEKAVWNTNEEISALLAGNKAPIMQKLSFDVAGGFKANVMLRLPPNIDTSGNTKYPMLINVYGGPDTYQVIDKFVLDWGSYLAANKSIIYAAIDGRGSGLKGDKIMFSGYRNLGTVEVEDQINVTRLIQESLPYVDSTRTAIWGWSYGGYAAGMALATDTEGVFKCGISVAPVTDWTLYDSIYTERFMGLPTTDDNLSGYENAQLLTKSEGIRNKEYFLIHGTYDDNVHYQQSMLWAKVLEQNDILFRQLSYPDEDHGLGLVRPHLYHSLESFLDECFIERED
ncbi:venom dipeptidyl peptidase 4 isoform X2 [Anoplophora glabripennis]|nr:venom dipeptidyl peptidase 4 isoform X2 [Anoplophora glabripennis]